MRIAALFSSLVLASCIADNSEGKLPTRAGRSLDGPVLDARIEALMAREAVQGLAVAVIEEDRTTHLRAYGFRNVGNALPLEPDTVMYGASLTKAAFAYMVLQLVDEGIVDLDRPIEDFLDNPLPSYPDWTSLEGEDEWRLLTPRIILAHATGLANLRFLEQEQDLEFHFTPGERYAYSGEGFYLLQFVLEEGLGLDVKAEMQVRVFDRFGMTRTDMQWREDFADNLADGYAMDGSFEPHDQRSWVSAQLPIRSARKFPTLSFHEAADSRGEAIDLSAGLGVETWQGPNGRCFAKGGHNEWTGNMVICQEVEQRCLVMLANSVRAEIIFPEITEIVLGETDYPWWWTYPELHGRD